MSRFETFNEALVGYKLWELIYRPTKERCLDPRLWSCYDSKLSGADTTDIKSYDWIRFHYGIDSSSGAGTNTAIALSHSVQNSSRLALATATCS